MCAFCVAIPAAVAVGANLNSKQLAARRVAEEKGTKLPAEKAYCKGDGGCGRSVDGSLGGLSHDSFPIIEAVPVKGFQKRTVLYSLGRGGVQNF